jgi:hypothetical protein
MGEAPNHSSLLLGDIEALYIYEIQIDKRFHRKVSGFFARCQSYLVEVVAVKIDLIILLGTRKETHADFRAGGPEMGDERYISYCLPQQCERFGILQAEVQVSNR